jgi:hypothetical protein
LLFIIDIQLFSSEIHACAHHSFIHSFIWHYVSIYAKILINKPRAMGHMGHMAKRLSAQ